MSYAIDFDDVQRAAQQIAHKAHRTPILTSRAINQLAGCEIFFKCENFQRVGAFKFRGATNAIANLPAQEAARGVVTHSSGNHAQAVALAAAQAGLDATIVMPTSAPAVKKAAVAGYGATIIDCAPTQAARQSTTQAFIERTGAALIHPYDNPLVMAGQGTVALELHEEVPDLDAIIAPVGGGGLMSGTAITTRALRPDCRILGAEPTGADDAARGKASGQRITEQTPDTIADGLLTTLGERPWPIVRDLVHHIHTVDDTQIRAAMRLILERMKIVIEPSSAVPLAALLSSEGRQPTGCRVGVIVSGGNVDLARLGELTGGPGGA